MDVFVLGVSVYPAVDVEADFRLEEMVYRTSRAALDSAGVSRRQLDNVTLGACDELDGRPISSMLMAAPAGAYLTDETKVTDSGLSALCLAFARLASGDFQAGLVASWCKSSKTDVDLIMRMRGDPFFTRPLGLSASAYDALFAQAVSESLRIDSEEVAQRVDAAYRRAALSPRAVKRPAPSLKDIKHSGYVATPIREGHCARQSDGAVSMVLATDKFLQANPHCKPLARIAGAGWASDSYFLGKDRLKAMQSFNKAWEMAFRQAGISSAKDLDLVELETPTGWHEAAYTRALQLPENVLSPSGGAFAQNPLFCTGLVNAAEAVLQVSGTAGAIQRTGVRRSAAHSCHGFAQQGNAVVVFEPAGGIQ